MLLFLDFETTGLESSDKICSAGIIVYEDENIFCEYELINEGKKIPPKASSIHHITNEDIKGKPSFKDSKTWSILEKYNHEESTLIAHNAPFELEILQKHDLFWSGKVIDTLRTTRHLIPECEFFSLQFLRYELKLYKEEQKELQKCVKNRDESRCNAHNALCDALYVKLLYNYLLDIKNHLELVELSSKRVIVEKLDFGKYGGRYIEEISMCDRGYLEWMVQNIEDMDEDLRYSIKRYL